MEVGHQRPARGQRLGAVVRRVQQRVGHVAHADVVHVDVAHLAAASVVGLDAQALLRAIEAVVVHVHVLHAAVGLRADRDAVAPVDVVVGNDDPPLAVGTHVAVAVDAREARVRGAWIVAALEHDVVVAGAHEVVGEDHVLQVAVERHLGGGLGRAAGGQHRGGRALGRPGVESVGVLHVVSREGLARVQRVAVAGRVGVGGQRRCLQLHAPDRQPIDAAGHDVEVRAVVQRDSVERQVLRVVEHHHAEVRLRGRAGGAVLHHVAEVGEIPPGHVAHRGLRVHHRAAVVACGAVRRLQALRIGGVGVRAAHVDLHQRIQLVGRHDLGVAAAVDRAVADHRRVHEVVAIDQPGAIA